MNIRFFPGPLHWLLLLVCAAALCPLRAEAAQPSPELRQAIGQVLREHPDLVLDILRDNSEVVLEIAQQGNLQRRRKATLAQWTEDAKTPKTVAADVPAVRGPADAPVTVVAYSDFTCPYCRQADAVLEEIYAKYDGKLRLIFKPLPKENLAVSQTAARFSTAAFLQDTEKGWRYYHALFAGVPDLERDGENFLKALAVKENLDLKRLVADASSAKVKGIIAAGQEEADRLDIAGTPYFLVNDLVVRGAVPRETFEEAIEMALQLKDGR